MTLPAAPTITGLTPSSDQVIIAPNVVELTCTAASRPIPSIQWYRDGTQLSMGDNHGIIMEYMLGGH